MHDLDMISVMSAFTPQRLHDLQGDPLSLLQRWPGNRPVAMLRSATAVGSGPWARWSLIAEPQGRLCISDRVTWHGPEAPPCPLPERADDPLAVLDQILKCTMPAPEHAAPTNGFPLPPGGWLGIFSYELGYAIEPASIGSIPHSESGQWPMIELLWCPAALVHDAFDGSWWSIGGAEAPTGDLDASDHSGLMPPASTPVHTEYIKQVQQVIDYIHAGDVFQVNLARRLRSQATLSPRALAVSAMQNANPRYGFYAELPGNESEEDRAVLSLSPELFLQVDGATRQVVTRPIKGTRPHSVPPEELAESSKDAAELHMIVDLMRNDLGRLCEPGTVDVVDGRLIESHPTVHHGVGEVQGRLRSDIGLADVLRATFPAGSITGAPKIRAMQIIHDLESIARGPYCGAMGWLTSQDACLSVGIRTLALQGRFQNGFTTFSGHVDYGTGGGIVADSDPQTEFQETEHKAAVFTQLVATTASVT